MMSYEYIFFLMIRLPPRSPLFPFTTLFRSVADRLRRPVISQAAELTLNDGRLRVKRQTEFGYDVIDAPLPAVIAVSDAINEPRYPSLKGIMGAKRKPQETVALGGVGVEAGAAGEEIGREHV